MWIIINLFFILLPTFTLAQELNISNPVGKNIENLIPISTNRSIMSCGEKINSISSISIYTSLDIQAILAISNMLSSETVKLETNWDTFSPFHEDSTSPTLNESVIQSFSEDIQRIIFYCLTWDESSRLKLFLIPKEAIDNITTSVMKQKPWKVLPNEIASRIDNFSEGTIKDFVYLVLRANVFYSIRGGFNKNPTLFATSFSWKTPIREIKKDKN